LKKPKNIEKAKIQLIAFKVIINCHFRSIPPQFAMRFKLQSLSPPLQIILASLFFAAPVLAQTDTKAPTEKHQLGQPMPHEGPEPTPDSVATENWNFFGQYTNVTQWNRRFRSPRPVLEDTKTFLPSAQRETTNDATLFIGLRLAPHTEFYINPEIDQGFGLSNAMGIAGYTSGTAYKLGQAKPYAKLQRAFVRHTINLGGEMQALDSDANQLAGKRTADNVVITVGKFSVVDIFDNNRYAHDPRGDFLNWSILDSGAFDYAADAWGFTFGAAVEWNQGDWTLRNGLFNLSTVPGGTEYGIDFKQFELVTEVEHRHRIAERSGALKLLAFVNRGYMASYTDAVQWGIRNAQAPDVEAVRKRSSQPGVAFIAEQELTPTLGMFVRASANGGKKETFDFTEITRSWVLGLSQNGAPWGRAQDTVGLAVVRNHLSKEGQSYFDRGGLGILIGEGYMPYAPEGIMEAYYQWQLNKWLSVALNYQRVSNPGYNRERGPVHVGGLRVHAEF
jgi:high affinity Mn2+ porin